MAGKKGKGNNTAGRIRAPKAPGEPIKIMNMSNHDNYCTQTGAVLPRNGMAYRHDGQLFISRNAVRQYIGE